MLVYLLYVYYVNLTNSVNTINCPINRNRTSFYELGVHQYTGPDSLRKVEFYHAPAMMPLKFDYCIMNLLECLREHLLYINSP